MGIMRHLVCAVCFMECTASPVKAGYVQHRLLQEDGEKEVARRSTLTCSRTVRYWMGSYLFKCSWFSSHTFFATRLAKVLCHQAWNGVVIPDSCDTLAYSEQCVQTEKNCQEYAEIRRSLGVLLYNDLRDKGIYPLLWKKNEVNLEAISRFWVSGLQLLDPTCDQEALVFCVRKLREGYGDHPIYERVEHYMRRLRHIPCSTLDDQERQLLQEVRDTIVYEQFQEIHKNVSPNFIRSSEYRVNQSLPYVEGTSLSEEISL